MYVYICIYVYEVQGEDVEVLKGERFINAV